MGDSDRGGGNSPEYSRPPSSTFKGYSFMNFRNDSVSSVGERDKNLSDKKESKRGAVNYDSNPSKTYNKNSPSPRHMRPIIAKAGETTMNIVDDY
jgi:hypothetical protein